MKECGCLSDYRFKDRIEKSFSQFFQKNGLPISLIGYNILKNKILQDLEKEYNLRFRR